MERRVDCIADGEFETLINVLEGKIKCEDIVDRRVRVFVDFCLSKNSPIKPDPEFVDKLEARLKNDHATHSPITDAAD